MSRPPAIQPSDGHGRLHLNCPRCGLTITAKAHWLAVEYCSRCLAHTRAAVRMFASTLPTVELYAEGSAPDADRAFVGEAAERRP